MINFWVSQNNNNVQFVGLKENRDRKKILESGSMEGDD